MYNTVDQFTNAYKIESDKTANVLSAISDQSLATQKSTDDKTSLADLAWHLAQAPVYILNQAGLGLTMPTRPENATAAQALEAYKTVSAEVLAKVKSWSDAELHNVKTFFGMEWSQGAALMATIHHEIHHRGQLSILMRQAGLKVPGIYGPNKEETEEFMKQQAATVNQPPADTQPSAQA